MKKTLVFLFVAIALVALVSCTSTATVSSAEPSAQSVYTGKFGIPVPSWVMNPPKAQDALYAVGTAKMSNDVNSKKAAAVNAKQNLATSIEVTIKGISSLYTNDAGENAAVMNTQAMQAFEELTLQKADQIMVGVSEDEYWIDNDGTAYCLVSIPAENIGKTIKEVFAKYVEENPTFVKNEAAAEANNMMNDAISKYFSKGVDGTSLYDNL